MADLQDRAAGFELTSTHSDHGRRIMAILTGLNASRSITTGPVRARDKYGANPLGRATRQDATSSGCLVIRMSVNRHQCQGLICHVSRLRTRAGPRDNPRPELALKAGLAA
jgi:hypothetical protein